MVRLRARLIFSSESSLSLALSRSRLWFLIFLLVFVHFVYQAFSHRTCADPPYQLQPWLNHRFPCSPRSRRWVGVDMSGERVHTQRLRLVQHRGERVGVDEWLEGRWSVDWSHQVCLFVCISVFFFAFCLFVWLFLVCLFAPLFVCLYLCLFVWLFDCSWWVCFDWINSCPHLHAT